MPGEAMVKLYCPKCMDVYTPKSSRHHHILDRIFVLSVYNNRKMLYSIVQILGRTKCLVTDLVSDSQLPHSYNLPLLNKVRIDKHCCKTLDSRIVHY